MRLSTLRKVGVGFILCGIVGVYQGQLRQESISIVLALKTYKVTLGKDSESTNRIVNIQAEDSSSAKKAAKEQNPGWKVVSCSEVKSN